MFLVYDHNTEKLTPTRLIPGVQTCWERIALGWLTALQCLILKPFFFPFFTTGLIRSAVSKDDLYFVKRA